MTILEFIYKTQIYSLDDLKRDYKRKNDIDWFDRRSMRFFNSRLSQDLFYSPNDSSIYFVSSEKFDNNSKRKYTIRKYIVDTGEIETIGGFQQYNSTQAAKRDIKKLISKL